jgi:hypothetical protein
VSDEPLSDGRTANEVAAALVTADLATRQAVRLHGLSSPEHLAEYRVLVDVLAPYHEARYPAYDLTEVANALAHFFGTFCELMLATDQEANTEYGGDPLRYWQHLATTLAADAAQDDD